MEYVRLFSPYKAEHLEKGQCVRQECHVAQKVPYYDYPYARALQPFFEEAGFRRFASDTPKRHNRLKVLTRERSREIVHVPLRTAPVRLGDDKQYLFPIHHVL